VPGKFPGNGYTSVGWGLTENQFNRFEEIDISDYRLYRAADCTTSLVTAQVTTFIEFLQFSEYRFKLVNYYINCDHL